MTAGEPLSIAWLTTGRGPGSFGALEKTLAAIEAGRIPVRIAVLFCNREPGEAKPTDRLLAYAAAHGVPVETLSSVRFRKERGGERSKPGEPLPAWRAEFDDRVAGILQRHRFDLGVLFGYMLIATPNLCGRFTLINEHPALPWGPTGTWQEVTHALIEQRTRESGSMLHRVTEDLDRGPVVSYCRFGLPDPDADPLWKAADPHDEEGPLFKEIRRLEVLHEVPLLHETLRFVASSGFPEAPSDLTEAVARALAAGA